MGIKDKMSGGLTKHSSLEILAVVIAGVVIASISLYLIIQQFGIAISFTLGNILTVYAPSLIILALSGGIMGYARTRNSTKFLFVGFGMMIVAIGFIIIQTLLMVYYGVSL